MQIIEFSMASTSSPSSNKNFKPTDEELIMLLYNKVHGKPMPNDATIIECDLYGKMNPWEIWEAFRGSNSYNRKDLYIFTTLKKKSPNGSRLSRTIGRGTGSWEGEDVGKPIVKDGQCVGMKKRFRFEKSDTIHDGGWIMHEFSLHPSLLSHLLGNNYALCRFRKNQKYEVQQNINNADHMDNEGTTINNHPRRRNINAHHRNNNEGTSNQQRRRITVLALPAIAQTGNNNVDLECDIYQGQREQPQSENNRTEFEYNEEEDDSPMSWIESFAEQLRSCREDFMEEEALIPNPFQRDLMMERMDERYLQL